MKNSTRFLTLLTLVIAGLFLFGTAVYAGNDDGGQKGFIDLNGDGFNDNMKDDDGDGIPNCVDEDYVKDGDGEGTGTANKNGNVYAYNFQLQPKWMVQSRHNQFYKAMNEIQGETPEGGLGNAGEIGEGIHNPGMSENATKPENAGSNGSK